MIEKRWSVDNSYELINKFSDIKTVRSIKIDFSTLYTNLTLDFVMIDSDLLF